MLIVLVHASTVYNLIIALHLHKADTVFLRLFFHVSACISGHLSGLGNSWIQI